MAEQTEKRLVSDELETICVNDMDIVTLIFYLNKHNEKYKGRYERLSIDNRKDEYEDWWNLKIFGWREETEHEAKSRAENQAIVDSNEYYHYLKLKEKFEK